ncbi:hypothetical protein [Paenibacillus turpanensis]|uniref:hypothetical protein n=1 Tax=Paenibacillus turpanensis TaxID=2689078 RepID=UPI00140E908B|nr:hypothetical protein [Paenibacillus turpanensis]
MLKNVLFCFSLILSSAFSLNCNGVSSTVLSEIKEKTDFRFMLPISNEWKVEVKYPYPLDLSKTISMVRLHYFDSNENYVVGIEQHRVSGYKITREETIIDVKNNEERTAKVEEYFTPIQRGELVYLNGIEARFESWANTNKGGILRWINDGTYLEMDSSRLTKTEMIDLAKSMK